MHLSLSLFYPVVFLLALVITALVRRMALKNNFMDIPNERSSHQIPVPQGGGIAIVLLSVIGVIALYASKILTPNLALPLLSALVLLAINGWMDDKYHLSVKIRLAVQVLVAVISLHYIGAIYNIGFDISFRIIAFALAAVWVIGFVNMYNFMDGIDGIIGLQAVISGLVIAFWAYLLNDIGVFAFALVVSASSLGFLVLNFSPAKIFCGDVGSTALGGVFAILGLYLHNAHGISIILFAGLFAFFIIDTAYTFIKRALRGEMVWLPHREHLYQQLSRKYNSHAKVTLGVAAGNIVISAGCTYYLWLNYINY